MDWPQPTCDPDKDNRREWFGWMNICVEHQ